MRPSSLRARVLTTPARICSSWQILLAEHPTLQPSATTYTALMRPCEADGNKKLAFSFYEECLSLGHQPDLLMFNSLIATCCAGKDFAAAENIFPEMRSKVRRRLRPARSLLAASDHARVALPAPPPIAQGVKPKSTSYLRYIWACFANSEPEKAYKMLLNMENEWRVPTRDDYTKM